MRSKCDKFLVFVLLLALAFSPILLDPIRTKATGSVALSSSTGATSFKAAGGATSDDLTTFATNSGSTCLIATLITSGSVTATSATWDNAGTPQAMTSRGGGILNSQRVEVFSLVNPHIGTLTLHFAWTTSRIHVIGAVAFSNTDTVTCVKTTDNNSATGTSTAPSITMTSDSAGATVAALAAANNITGVASGTQIFRDSSTTPGSMTYTLGGTSNAHTWAQSSGTFAISGVHIIAANTVSGCVLGGGILGC